MKKWIYKHFKWKLYEVLWITINTETEEELVLYKPLYNIPDLLKKYWEIPYFVRWYDNFFENIELNWKRTKRFKYIWNKKFDEI